MRLSREVQVVSVFAAGPGGGNPAPIIVDAEGMSDAQMQEVAQTYGHESGFVLPAPAGSNCDFEFRFWVPNHEMSMCGHATVGALWLLRRANRLPAERVTIWTKSGPVQGQIADQAGTIEISQPAARVEVLSDSGGIREEILDVLGMTPDQLEDLPLQNASTSRVKTLIPLKDVDSLDRLRPKFEKVQMLCERIGSTGLYPYAPLELDRQIFDARQFPRSSGYPEDAATGIAAAALSFGLLANGLLKAADRPIVIRQGRAMSRPSEISVRFDLDGDNPKGCWLGGAVMFEPRPGQSA